jgi:hypothetical protein
MDATLCVTVIVELIIVMHHATLKRPVSNLYRSRKAPSFSWQHMPRVKQSACGIRMQTPLEKAMIRLQPKGRTSSIVSPQCNTCGCSGIAWRPFASLCSELLSDHRRQTHATQTGGRTGVSCLGLFHPDDGTLSTNIWRALAKRMRHLHL